MTIKLGVLVLAGPDNGGTYQYSLSVLQSLKYTNGFEITLYGNPENPELVELGYPICPLHGSHTPGNWPRWWLIECISALPDPIRFAGHPAGAHLFPGAAAYVETVCIYVA